MSAVMQWFCFTLDCILLLACVLKCDCMYFSPELLVSRDWPFCKEVPEIIMELCPIFNIYETLTPTFLTLLPDVICMCCNQKCVASTVEIIWPC
jgi:hypothetical protein